MIDYSKLYFIIGNRNLANHLFFYLCINPVFLKSPSLTVIESLEFNALVFHDNKTPSRASVPTARHNNFTESPSKRTFTKQKAIIELFKYKELIIY